MKNKFRIFTIILITSLQFSLLSQSEWNLDFENWDTTDITAELWHDTTVVENRSPIFPPKWHYRTSHIPEGTGLARTTDATEGEFAVAMSGFYSYEVMRIISGDKPSSPGWPIDFRPYGLSGDYKAILLGECDSLRAYVDIFLTKFDQLNETRDTIGQSSLVLIETNTYREFNLDIKYENMESIPDTVILVLAKRRFGFDVPPDCLECSHVFFDNLNFSNTLSNIKSNSLERKVKMYPNPSNQSRVSIETDCRDCLYNITLISASGYKLKKYESVRDGTAIDVGDLKSGFYFVKIENSISGHYVYEKLVLE